MDNHLTYIRKIVAICIFLVLNSIAILNVNGQKLIGGFKVSGANNFSNKVTNAICDTVFSFPTIDIWPGGLAYDGNYFYSISAYNTKLNKYDINGTFIDSFPLPSSQSPTAGDIDFDGNYLWLVLEEESKVYQIDQNNGSVIKSFWLPGGTSLHEYFGCAYDDGFLWIAEYSQKLLIKIDTITGSVVDSFFTNRWVLPLKIINGELYGIEFVNQSAGGAMQLIKFDKTNGSISDSMPWCLPYSLGFATTGSNIWGLSSGQGFGSKRIYKFESLILSTNNNVSSIDKVKVFPNPAFNMLNIQSDSEFYFEIYNTIGVLLHGKSMGKLNETIDISSLANGVYILRITKNNKITYSKFLKK